MAKKSDTSVIQETPETVTVDTVTEVPFDKGQLVGCSRYAGRSDLVNALLEDGKMYTFSQVDKMISDFDGADFTENNERKGE